MDAESIELLQRGEGQRDHDALAGTLTVGDASLNLSSFFTCVTPVTPITTGLPVDVWDDYNYFSFSLNGFNGMLDKGFLRATVTQP